MKIIKRSLLILGVLIILLLGAALAVPVLFKEQLTELAKEQINTNLNAEVDFKEVSVSLFRSFPRLSLSVDSFSVVGIDTFARLPLARGTAASFALDLWSVISDPSNVQIKSVQLVDPDINILVLKNGMANYDVAIASETSTTEAETTSSEMSFALDSYSITNGRFSYEDHVSDTYFTISGLDHSGSGNFTLETFDLDTYSEVEALTVRQGGVNYLSDARAELAAIFSINTAESKYTLKDNRLTVNDLTLEADGYVAMPTEDIELDLTFRTPESDFRSLWSLIPAAYTQDYDAVDIAGQFELEGSVKGTYSAEPERYPSFRVHTAVSDGNVKYPDLPLGINDIVALIDIESPSDQLDDLTINIGDLRLRLGQDPFKANLLVSKPISDPTIKGAVDGIIDLAQWSKALPMEGLEELSGRIVADIAIDAASSAIEAGNYDRIKMQGGLEASGINYRATGLPPIQIERAVAGFTPQNVAINDFQAQLGKSDVRATGRIDNILAYISPQKTMTGQFDLQSNYFDAYEWVPAETETSNQVLTPAEMDEANLAATTNDTEIFDRFDFDVNVEAQEISYDTYQLTNSSLSGRVQPNRIRIDDVQSTMGETTFKGTGTILNAFDYSFSDGVLGGQIDVRSTFVNLDDFMPPAEEGTAEPAGAPMEEEALAPVPVPERINLAVKLDADRVKYSNLTLNNVVGILAVRDEQLFFEDGAANLLGGRMGFAGAYDASDLSEPGFSFKYNLKDLDFGQAFSVLNTFSALMPIGKFLEGTFSSDLIVDGTLGQNMYPVLSSINAEGFIQTLNAALNGFKPLNAVGNALNIKELQNTINLNNVTSWFLVEDGSVKVEPFPFRVGDARFTASGTHGLNQNMNYGIDAVIPRALLEGNAIGSTVNKGIDALIGQANKLGVSLEQSDTVNIKIKLTGSLTDPKVGFDLLGTSGGGGTAGAITQQKDSLVADAKEQLNETTDEVKKEVKSTVDTLANNLKNQAKDQIQDALGVTKDTTSTSGNTTGEIKKTVDDIKKDLEKFNPFKKKKKNTERDTSSGGEE